MGMNIKNSLHIRILTMPMATLKVCDWKHQLHFDSFRHFPCLLGKKKSGHLVPSKSDAQGDIVSHLRAEEGHFWASGLVTDSRKLKTFFWNI